MASGRKLSGLAVGAIGIGSLFVYGGVTGRSPLAAFQSLVQGSPPSATPQAAPIASGGPGFFQGLIASLQSGAASSPAAPSSSGPATATQPSAADAIVSYARSFVGAGYVFGGQPAKGRGQWDCSSFVNWIVGHLVGLKIPGYAAGAYTGTVHGPIALQWYAWSGATTIGHKGADALPGDLACWQTHIGICIGGGQMISARSAKTGTGQGAIDGAIPGELLSIRRLKP
jgi:cell wall-associated NlpC family hydrolase